MTDEIRPRVWYGTERAISTGQLRPELGPDAAATAAERSSRLRGRAGKRCLPRFLISLADVCLLPDLFGMRLGTCSGRRQTVELTVPGLCLRSNIKCSEEGLG